MNKMTIEDIEKEIEHIKECRYDNEIAHILEDKLWQKALEQIAEGDENAQEIAKAVLKTKDVSFVRWYG